MRKIIFEDDFTRSGLQRWVWSPGAASRFSANTITPSTPRPVRGTRCQTWRLRDVIALTLVTGRPDSL
jgi:hypothetical protein